MVQYTPYNIMDKDLMFSSMLAPFGATSISFLPILRAFSVVFARLESPRLIRLLSIMLKKGPEKWKNTESSQHFFYVLIATFLLRQRLSQVKKSSIGGKNQWIWLSLADKRRLMAFFFTRKLPSDLNWSVAQFLPTVADTLITQLKELEQSYWVLARKQTWWRATNILEKERWGIDHQLLPALNAAILSTPPNESLRLPIENQLGKIEKMPGWKKGGSTLSWMISKCRWILGFMHNKSSHAVFFGNNTQLPAQFGANKSLAINLRGEIATVAALRDDELPINWFSKSREIGSVTRDLLTETAYLHMAEVGMTQEKSVEHKEERKGSIVAKAGETSTKKRHPGSTHIMQKQTTRPKENRRKLYSRLIANIMGYIRARLSEVPNSSSISTHRRRKFFGLGVGPTCADRVSVALRFIDFLSQKSVHKRLPEPVFLHPSIFKGQLAESANEARPHMVLISQNLWV